MAEFKLGLAAVRSFKRLSYTPWHAFAEFVDNSTQSYLDHREELDAAFEREGSKLEVDIEYGSSQDRFISIRDNAMGMSLPEVERALVVGVPPPDPTGRSRYGFGLKTAASWFGDLWTVETKRLGEPVGQKVTVDVEAVATGDPNLVVVPITNVTREDHYTRIEIRQLNRTLHGATQRRIREFLRSMYRQDLQAGWLKLVWMHEALVWNDTIEFATGDAGRLLRRDFDFTIGVKRVHGWAGVLSRGGRPKAGFAILHAGRVIRGAPASWRPPEIYGQILGSNDLVNQRLTGEIHLDDFAVSHTKDDIHWVDDEEQEVGHELKTQLADLIRAANQLRRPLTPAPTTRDARLAIQDIQEVLGSEAVQHEWLNLPQPPESLLRSRKAAVLSTARSLSPQFQASINGLSVLGYLRADLDADQPYVTIGVNREELSVVVNLHHPHVRGMNAAVLSNHLQHCTFEALAEWHSDESRRDSGRDLVEFFKDALFRIEPPGNTQSSS